MSYLALYRKYRPSSFNDFVGQSETANIIKSEILNDRISHAYLFSGPRGTGKTSTAKIIARMINCSNLSSDGVPCGKCNSCVNFNSSSDIVEIDAASNNGVDEIRELRDKVNLVPTYGKYKIYIIDEVHMLTTQAFNALLKTLEEPPGHAIFILATTEFYKIPVTVVSRCQKFQFLKFSIEEIVSRLKRIADSEKIMVNDDVLYEIARLSDGGLRDAINMLDQLSSFKIENLTVDDVYKLNGVLSYAEFKNLLCDVNDNNFVSIVNFFEEFDRTGKSFERFIEDFISFLKDILIYKNSDVFLSSFCEKNNSIKYLADIFSSEQIYNFIISLNDLFVRIKNSSFSKVLLVAEFINLSNLLMKDNCDGRDNTLNYKANNKFVVNDNNSNVLNRKSAEITNELTQKSIITDAIKKVRINNAFATASKENKRKFLDKWSLVLEKVSNDFNYVSVAGLLNDVEVLVVGEKDLILLAQYDSLIERLFEQIDEIQKLFFDVFGIFYKIVFLNEEEWEFEKKSYINNLKSSKKYVYIEENDTILNGEVVHNDDVDKLISFFGNDIVKYN